MPEAGTYLLTVESFSPFRTRYRLGVSGKRLTETGFFPVTEPTLMEWPAYERARIDMTLRLRDGLSPLVQIDGVDATPKRKGDTLRFPRFTMPDLDGLGLFLDPVDGTSGGVDYKLRIRFANPKKGRLIER